MRKLQMHNILMFKKRTKRICKETDDFHVLTLLKTFNPKTLRKKNNNIHTVL